MPYLTHGEAFSEMWDLSREWDKRRSDFEALACHCMEQAAAGVPCIQYDAPDYPMAKFVCAIQDDNYAPMLAQVFSTFVRHGLLKPNERFVLSRDCPDHYKNLFGELPLMQAVLKGNIHAAEQLVLHGADTSYRVPDKRGGYLGEDFFDYVLLHFGETDFRTPKPEQRAAAAARLIEASLTWHIANAPSDEQATGPRPARRLRAV